MPRRDEADCEPHYVGAPHPPHPMHVVLFLIGERHVDHVRQLSNVKAARGHIRAHEEPNVALLERGEIATPLVGGALAGQHAARERVLNALLELACEQTTEAIGLNQCRRPQWQSACSRVLNALREHTFEGAPATRRIQEGFKVVTIEVGATEDDGLRHLEPLDHPEQHVWLEALDGL